MTIGWMAIETALAHIYRTKSVKCRSFRLVEIAFEQGLALLEEIRERGIVARWGRLLIGVRSSIEHGSEFTTRIVLLTQLLLRFYRLFRTTVIVRTRCIESHTEQTCIE